MKILLVEDDRRASDYLTKGLRELGHAVEQAFDGETGRLTALAGGFDVLILDRMLPRLATRGWQYGANFDSVGTG